MPTGSDKFRCSSLYTDNIIERNPARAALEPSPACSRAFAGFDFHDGVHADRDILCSCVVRPRSFADVKVGNADLHEERHGGRRRRSSCFRCVDVYTVYIKHTISRILIRAFLGVCQPLESSDLGFAVRPRFTDTVPCDSGFGFLQNVSSQD